MHLSVGLSREGVLSLGILVMEEVWGKFMPRPPPPSHVMFSPPPFFSIFFFGGGDLRKSPLRETIANLIPEPHTPLYSNSHSEYPAHNKVCDLEPSCPGAQNRKIPPGYELPNKQQFLPLFRTHSSHLTQPGLLAYVPGVA